MIQGVDKNYWFDGVLGIIFGVGFILLNNLIPQIGSIGIPSLPQSIASEFGKWVIIVIAASIFESIFFFDFILDFFDEKVANMPFFLAAFFTALSFALFHFYAYGETLQAFGGGFLSAGLIGFAWCYLKKYTKSVLPLITSHMVINAYLLYNITVIVA